MFLLFARIQILILMMCFLLGCGADESRSVGKIPSVTIELVELPPDLRQQEKNIRFRVNAVPALEKNLAVLVESQIWRGGPTGQDFSYTWVMIPKFANSKEFGLSLDKYISWEVAILPLSGVSLNDYPISGFGIPADYVFSGYTLGNPSKVVTEQKFPAKLRDVWPDSGIVPANATYILTFDPLPEDIKVSHGRVIFDGDVVKIVGPFPIGRLELKISWDSGHGNYTIRDTISEPDYKSPELIRAIARTGGGSDIGFIVKELGIENSGVPQNTEWIELVFDERVWINKEIHGNIELQTVAGENLGWEEKRPFLGRNEIHLIRPEGKPLKRGTDYVIVGTVTDTVNETEIKYLITTWN
ncbi:MAG: hypothetical protein OXM61_10785 [Candidatus Poribacteria bacterium]|nr:hypothetical protein [Candidatus Poribacteria bacterium]